MFENKPRLHGGQGDTARIRHPDPGHAFPFRICYFGGESAAAETVYGLIPGTL